LKEVVTKGSIGAPLIVPAMSSVVIVAATDVSIECIRQILAQVRTLSGQPLSPLQGELVYFAGSQG
jgi:hypothetical protein